MTRFVAPLIFVCALTSGCSHTEDGTEERVSVEQNELQDQLQHIYSQD